MLVRRDAHLLELCRYVVLNPVRAGPVGRAEDWRWSSCRATAGFAARPEALCTDWVLRRFGHRRRAAQRAYAAFVAEGARPVWDDLKGQIYLGDDAFIAQMKSRVDAADTLVDVPRQQRLPAPRPLATYEDEAGTRADAMAAACAGGHSLRAIARHFRRARKDGQPRAPASCCDAFRSIIEGECLNADLTPRPRPDPAT